MEKLCALPIEDIQINDAFWNRYTRLVPEVVLPYQWEILNDRMPDTPPSYCLHNFRVAAGEARGRRQGTVFLDTDAYKWLEAVGYSLATRPDATLEKNADEVIALIGRAQCKDGYLDTYYTLVEPEGRWKNLVEGHELYCAGHLIEAAVAYYSATGKRALLDIACRFADLIAQVFGPGEAQMHGCPGHPEVELALVRLYHATGKATYLDLARYFINVRGAAPNYFLQEMARPDFRRIFPELNGYEPAYSQSHLPVRQQVTAEGHAVRAVYLYSAMADVALLDGDVRLLEQCRILWDNMVQKRMFITGGIGSSGLLERFTTDYDLPGDAAYNESCASIGLALFGLRMARAMRDASYIDVVERALYNTVRAGISLSGNRFFYVNPLEVWPAACMERTSKAHVKPVRQKWFDCACCPTNIARTFTSLGQYIYSAGEDELFVNLFVQNETKLSLGGKPVGLRLATEYPKSGEVRLNIEAEAAGFALYLRVPDFAEAPALYVNGREAPLHIEKGFAVLRRTWGKDEVLLRFGIRPKLVYANPLVRANVGKVALVRGPEVYCFEEVDNGADLAALYLAADAQFEEVWEPGLLGGTMLLRCSGARLAPWAEAASFSDEGAYQTQPLSLTALPYGSWGNRGPGEMIVWVHLLM